jgi:hypothetical protein
VNTRQIAERVSREWITDTDLDLATLIEQALLEYGVSLVETVARTTEEDNARDNGGTHQLLPVWVGKG